jgi:hypothetical protein
MRETRTSGSEGGAAEPNRPFLPLSMRTRTALLRWQKGHRARAQCSEECPPIRSQTRSPRRRRTATRESAVTWAYSACLHPLEPVPHVRIGLFQRVWPSSMARSRLLVHTVAAWGAMPTLRWAWGAKRSPCVGMIRSTTLGGRSAWPRENQLKTRIVLEAWPWHPPTDTLPERTATPFSTRRQGLP